MKRSIFFLTILLALLLLAACTGPTPASPTSIATTAVEDASPPATAPTAVEETPAAQPSPKSTLRPTPTPLPPEIQALLEERDLAAYELFSTLDKAQMQNTPQEQLDDILRSQVATVEAIEATLREKNIPFSPLNLPPTPAVDAKKEVFDIGMVTEDGVHIQGTYYRPAATDAPGVVLLHMLGRKRGDWDAFARLLQEGGYGVIAIDLRGHGESEGERDWDKMTQDAAIAASFIRSRPEIDPDRIVVMGASIGANIAINYAAQDEKIVGAALLSPGLDYRGVKTGDAVKQFGDRPLFIAASEEDEYATQSARQLDNQAQGPHTLLILENQGHGTQMLGKNNGLEEALLQWLAEVTTK